MQLNLMETEEETKFKKGIMVKVESFSHKAKYYNVDKEKKTCTCPDYQKRSKNKKDYLCKHLRMVLKIRGDNSGFSNSLLKSAIQKAVRRNDKEKAVVCAKALIEQDAQDFARRLPIIVVEDVLPHPKYSYLIYTLKNISKHRGIADKKDKEVMINVVADLADAEYRDDFVDEGGIIKNKELERGLKYLSENESKKLSSKENLLVGGIKYRSMIGGMKGDIVYLQRIKRLWEYRFLSGKWSFEDLNKYFKLQEVEYEEIPEIEKKHIMRESVDFHCSPLLKILMRKGWVVNLLKQYYPQYDETEVMKGIIWKQRSSVNYKKEISTNEVRSWYGDNMPFLDNNEDADKIIWNKIKREVDNISDWFIAQQ